MVWGITKTPVDFGPSFAGVLDSLPASAAAYSVARRLLTSYTGPLIRVRRSSDSTELDISYNAAGDLDTAALLAFCGAGDGFVAKIYDQSGNTLDVSQATAALQPKIVASGVAITGAMFVRASSQVLANGTTFTAGLINAVCSANEATYAQYGGAVTRGDNVGTLPLGIIGEQTLTRLYEIGLTTTHVNGVDTPNTPMNDELFVACSSATPSSWVAIKIGRDRIGAYWEGRIAEAIVWSAVLSDADRITLEADQMAYYGIIP